MNDSCPIKEEFYTTQANNSPSLSCVISFALQAMLLLEKCIFLILSCVISFALQSMLLFRKMYISRHSSSSSSPSSRPKKKKKGRKLFD
jgi:hypothetical protein